MRLLLRRSKWSPVRQYPRQRISADKLSADAIFHGRRRRDAQLMAVHAAFTEKSGPLLLYRPRLPSRDPTGPWVWYSAFLDIKNRIRRVSLHEGVLIFFQLKDAFAFAHFGEKDLSIKCALGWLPQSSLLCLIIW
jgi:hypothetical protein